MPIVNPEYFKSTFNIITATDDATSFIITVNDKQYLITAKHLFKGVTNGEFREFKLFINENLMTFNRPIFIHKTDRVDIAVIPLEKDIIERYSFTISGNDFALGEDVFFFGYPYFLSQTLTDLNFKMPLVKASIVSGVKHESDAVLIYLDGHNNPGFSGGPVGFYNFRDKSLHILSIISGYIAQNNNVATPFGPIVTPENSGIILSYSIKHVNEIIAENRL